MSTNLAATNSNSGAVASTESPRNNITVSNGIGVGLLESKSETLMKEWSSDHHEGILVGGVSVDDAMAFGDERGTVMESVEEVPEFNKNGVTVEDNKGEYKVFDGARNFGDERGVLMESVEVMKFSENGVNDKEKEGGDARVSGDTKAILMESVEEASKFNENRVSDEQKESEYMAVDEEALKFNENDEEKEGEYKVFDDAMVSEDDKAILMGSVGEASKCNENAVDDEGKEGEYTVFNDVRVSGDEMGIFMKPIEEVSKFNENGVNDEQEEGKLLDDARVSSDEKEILVEPVEDVLECNETGINDEEKEGEVFEDVRVSGDEMGIVMEPIEEVSKFNENGVNHEGKEGKLLDDAKVSGDEKEILVEPVEYVLEFNEMGINDEEKEGENKVSDDSRVFGDEKGTSMESVGLRSIENGADSEEKEGTYKVFDLVWAKVKSYPWWPGLIFDPSASTKKARKYFKKDGLLIAYFGDQTFAWNEASKVKLFRMHFCEMEKQSNTKSFCNAVNCALDEAARRVEFGLACSCLADEVYTKIKSQVFVNAGIRKESSRVDGGDNFSTVASFKPALTLQFVQDLAKEYFDGISRLEALTAKAQLLAFYRWKGYYQLTPDKVLGESDDNSELPSTGEEKLIRDAKTTPLSEEVLSRKRKLKTCDSGSSPSKKKRCSRNAMPNSSSSVPKRENRNTKSGSKRTFVESNGSMDRTQNEIADNKSSVSPSKKHFRVGDSICRIARQLSESPLILKKEPQTLKVPYSYPPTDEILSQICVAATNPVEEMHTMHTLVTFCTDFKNYLIEKNSQSIEINSIDKMCIEQPEENSYQSEAIENSATALILKFTNLDSVPSVMNLNEIFSRYGPLREMETEVMRKNNCAKVVFERWSNAETAFSSAGKFSIFGPSLISYCLDYSPSPCKAPKRSSKRNRKD